MTHALAVEQNVAVRSVERGADGWTVVGRAYQFGADGSLAQSWIVTQPQPYAILKPFRMSRDPALAATEWLTREILIEFVSKAYAGAARHLRSNISVRTSSFTLREGTSSAGRRRSPIWKALKVEDPRSTSNPLL